jgi:hypothetical protein
MSTAPIPNPAAYRQAIIHFREFVADCMGFFPDCRVCSMTETPPLTLTWVKST